MSSPLRLSLIRLLIGFITGVALAGLTGPVALLPLVLVLVLLTGIIGFNALILPRKLSYSSRWIPGTFIVLSYVLGGYILALCITPGNNPDDLVHVAGPLSGFTGRITEPPVIGKKSLKFTLSVISVRCQDQWTQADGNIIVYGRKNTPVPELKFGDTLLIASDLSPVPEPLNPGQFNYRKYLERRGIHHQAYLAQDNFRLIGHMRSWSIKKTAYKAHRSLSGILAKSGLPDQERATAQALLLGDKSQLDEETYQAYSSSGTVHILCVSGLHVGVIYMILNFLLGFLPRKGTGKVLRFLLVIILIWFYAFLTGLSPSVLRATVMFSILVIGKTTRRNTNIYNTLAASALLLLALNPIMIRDTGFQLSYLAVIGIVSLQPWIRNLVTMKYWFPARIWELLSVSLAAQLLTFPLTVHLFHQFPNYFLLANVLVVPLSGFIIYAGILVFVTSPVPLLWKGICWIFGWMISAMNGMVTFIEKLPFSTLTGLSMDWMEVILLYALMVAATYVILLRKRGALYPLLVLSVAFVFYNGFHFIQSSHQKQIVVYSVPGSSAAGFIHGRKGTIMTDSALQHNPSRIKMQMSGHWVECRLESVQLTTFAESMDCMDEGIRSHHQGGITCLLMDGRSLMVVHGRIALKRTDGNRIPVDYLLLAGNPAVRIRDLIKVFDVGCIIADMSNSRWRVKKWAEEVAPLGITFHSTADQGAFLDRWK
ncbi:MAG: ComEC/Rec2 family competence protein [Bacteroidales bacterium]|nr:ComEC family competence protein [Lentimicrobiaceae bacterium]MDD5694125.1 ComEC/Rec2 family competence protein [Bacteroidales bacterium]